jgi:hypothetical protein
MPVPFGVETHGINFISNLGCGYFWVIAVFPLVFQITTQKRQGRHQAIHSKDERPGLEKAPSFQQPGGRGSGENEMGDP